MKRKATALLCALLLCVGLLPAHALTEGDVYFTSVNDILLPLSEASMPIWVSGALYVPAATFDNGSTGSNLGLHFNYNKTAGMLTIYTIDNMLVFDLNRGTVYDQRSGQNLSLRAVTRNSQLYLPVELVCDFFDLEDSYTYTQWGYLVRIKDENARLSDARFLDAAGTVMRDRMEELMAAQIKADPTPADPVKPTDPTPGGAGESQTSAPQTPNEPQLETQICLAVRCESGEGLKRILDTLEAKRWYALFLFTPEMLLRQDDLVRRAIGSGHIVGLIGQSGEELACGNQTLIHVARTATTVALIYGERRAELKEQGWICWEETAQAVPRTGERATAFAQRVTQSIAAGRRIVYLTTDDSAAAAAALGTLLTRLEQRGCTGLTPLESRL